jgi:Membrane proteins related to metalloendopeptidases
MLLVKSLIAIKRLIYGITIAIIKPLFLVFKFLFTKPIIKLYYLFFKFKKSDLAESPWHVLVKQKALHILVFCLTLLVIISNLVNFNRNTDNVTAQASKTIVSHLAKNEFSTITDDNELIEDVANLKQILSSGQETYGELIATITNRPWVSDVSDDTDTLVYDDGALINDTPLNPSGETEEPAATTGAPANRQEIIYYVVGNGDTISSIANKFRISINTILWSNNLTAFSLIRPGDKLTILPVSGTVYTIKSGDTVGKIARKFGVEENSITQYNAISGGLVIGKTLIIPGGKKISDTVAAVTRPATTKSSGAAAVIEKLITPSKAPASTGAMVWPTVGHRITQYYSWRHTGLDIANHVGTPLYAADSGTVEFSGWSNGYGNNIVINHGNGRKTRYAHASKLYVKVGERVDRGEQIAAMGSTGWSTGPHIHFEVMVNGAKLNPLNYIR